MPWYAYAIAIVGYLIMGLANWKYLYSSINWEKGSFKIARFLIITLWPLWFVVVVFAIIVAIFVRMIKIWNEKE